jgi:hypothetical protein
MCLKLQKRHLVSITYNFNAQQHTSDKNQLLHAMLQSSCHHHFDVHLATKYAPFPKSEPSYAMLLQVPALFYHYIKKNSMV